MISKKALLKDDTFYKSKKGIALLLLLFVLYKVVLDLVYIDDLGIAFSYMFLCIDLSIPKMIASYALVCLSFVAFSISRGRITRYLILIIILFIYIPCLSYYASNNQSTIYTVFLTLSLFMISFFSWIGSNFKPPKIRSSAKVEKQSFLNALFFIFVALCLILVVVRGGIDYRSFSFKTIYSLRSENNISGFLGYVMNWLPKFFFPLLASFFIMRKKYKSLLCIVIIEVLMYLSFGNKAFLLCIVWVFLCYFLVYKKRFFVGMTFLLIVGVLGSYLLSKLFQYDSLRNTLNLRLLFVPAQIQYQYFDYFSTHAKMYYAEGFIGKLFGIENRFGEDVAYFIGRLYSNGGETHSNTCVFADAYYNAGFISMILTSSVMGLIFGFYDRLSNVKKEIIIGSLSYIMFSFMDTGLFTTLITGGLLFNILFMLYCNSTANPDFQTRCQRFVHNSL